MASSASLPSSTMSMESTLAQQRAYIQAERASIIAVYLLCRVLIEIFRRSTIIDLSLDMAGKLEDIIFKQLLLSEPEQLEDSLFKQSNWVIFGQVLGTMSEMDFRGVTERYVRDLQARKLNLGLREGEQKAVLIIRGMRWIRLQYQPDAAWDQTCKFLSQLGTMALATSGQPVKYAFNNLFEELLLPIAAGATSEINIPRWASVIEIIKPRLVSMLAKPKHWQNVFPTLAVVLCVSPVDTFSSQWLSLIAPLQPRLKERTFRPAALAGISRLIWTYLFRTSDLAATVMKNLSDVVKLVFIPGKKSYISTDPDVAEPLIQLIRIIGYKHRDFCFKNIIFPLMNTELFSSGKDVKLADVEPEKIVIGIRAFLAIMADVEKGEQPPFPITFDNQPILEPSRLASVPLSPRSTIDENPKTSLSREERLSRPVVVSAFDSVTTDAYSKFCKILGDITLFCDNTFGGQAVLDEKFSTHTPKTPISEAFSFGRKDDHQGDKDLRQPFYDLLHVAVQALPRCLPPSSRSLVNKSLVNLLCTATAHVKSAIAASAVQSVKSIAKQGHAQQVTVGFAKFIFNFDGRYSTMTDGGLLGPEHIESTLKLYVELLQIWIDEIKQNNKRGPNDSQDDAAGGYRGVQLDRSGQWAHVDEVESHGLFFLCSPSRRVRAFAVTVLRIVVEFDTALGQDSIRIISILDGSPQDVIDVQDEKLTVAERSRLQKALKKGGEQNPVIELCSSDAAYDATLWFKLFPRVIRLSSEKCPQATTLTREIVCGRISQMQKTILLLSEANRAGSQQPMVLDIASSTGDGRLANTSPDILIDQWRLYLIFACTTLTKSGLQLASPTPAATHTRKASRAVLVTERIQSASELFARIIPLVASSNQAVRDAVVMGLGSINKNLYRTLLEALQPAVMNCNEEAKARINSHQRGLSSPRKRRRSVYLRTEIAHVYKLTSHFLQSRDVYEEEWILGNLVNYTQELRLFLNDAEIQTEWEFHKLRTHYCGLMEELYEGIRKTADPTRWISFQARKAAFALMEDWCGYSPNQSQIRQREDTMRRSMLEREQELGGKSIVTAAMEIEKRDLKTAALSAMATLCAGPVSMAGDAKVQQFAFDLWRMLAWIDSIFGTPSDKTHAIGKRALKNLIVHNQEHKLFLDRSLEMCYLAKTPKALESYFEVVTQVLTDRISSNPDFWKVIGACLITMGNENNLIRIRSARLLRTLEEREYKSSTLQELDISISDKTIAVYKRAQFEMSQRLAQQHPGLAFHVISEFSKFFKDLQRDHQRNMVAALLPWIQTIELKVDPNGGPTPSSHMVLVNLFEITVKFGNALHNEIQALWQALATGPHSGNVQLILDFIISICLDRREQSFVDYARQIVVYLASTAAGSKVVEFLLRQITPKTMVQDKDKRQSYFIPDETHDLPYVSDIGQIFPEGPSGNRQQGVSLGQLALILLVDLMVAPTEISKEFVPLLLNVILILWDHYIPRVQDQAREMLVHLIHELIISKMQESASSLSKGSLEDFIELIRSHDPKVVWSYDDFNGKNEHENDIRVPESMTFVCTQVVNIFSTTYPEIKEQLGKTALKWASNCHVIHLACRSFQVFRSILGSLEQPMLADMLARLSNTIADEGTEVQTFSMEILTTLKTIISAFPPTDLIQYPQLFWTTCACLDTVHEKEYMESLAMLEKIMEKLDLSDPSITQSLLDNKPPKWEGSFDGLLSLIYKGVRSSVSLERSLRVIEKLVVLPPSELIGDDSGILFAILANFPRYLRAIEHAPTDPLVFASAERLCKIADSRGFPQVAVALKGFLGRIYPSDKDFFDQVLSAIKPDFFPDFEFQSLVFLMSLLTNKLPWFKIKVMHILCMIIPEIDMRKPEIASKGPDLITPLLRLLQTEFCPQALAVLDNVMTMNATPMDHKHLRMSMIAPNSSRAIRKEYEKTQSLYGIPEESGWSIPIPAIHMASTRSNVHAVFYTCASSETSVPTEGLSPEIELVDEEYSSRYMPDYRTATMVSDDTRLDGPMGDLVTKLESLDDFFDDDMPDLAPSSHSEQVLLGKFSASTTDVTSNIYEQQTYPLLHQSLTRNASVSSFHNGFSDLRVSPSREAMVMTPTAFMADSLSVASTLTPSSHSSTSTVRPSLHTRSATSPSGHGHSNKYSISRGGMSIDESSNMGDDPAFLSDDDVPLALSHLNNEQRRPPGAVMGNAFGPGGILNIPQLPPQQNSIRGGIRLGFRSHIRRLTSGNGDARAREAVRQQQHSLERSPQVPKVPQMYLQNTRSGDL
jgi:Cell morphogenesis N-terminal/Cell morphogenesis C-terminal/Cell morphogenesis central region